MRAFLTEFGLTPASHTHQVPEQAEHDGMQSTCALDLAAAVECLPAWAQTHPAEAYIDNVIAGAPGGVQVGAVGVRTPSAGFADRARAGLHFDPAAARYILNFSRFTSQ